MYIQLSHTMYRIVVFQMMHNINIMINRICVIPPVTN